MKVSDLQGRPVVNSGVVGLQWPGAGMCNMRLDLSSQGRATQAAYNRTMGTLLVHQLPVLSIHGGTKQLTRCWTHLPVVLQGSLPAVLAQLPELTYLVANSNNFRWAPTSPGAEAHCCGLASGLWDPCLVNEPA